MTIRQTLMFTAGVGAAVGLELFFRWVDGESWDDVASVQSEAWDGRGNYRELIMLRVELKERPELVSGVLKVADSLEVDNGGEYRWADDAAQELRRLVGEPEERSK